jgi:hypothetical protein
MLIMGLLRVLCIGLYLLTFCEWLHGFTDGCLDFYREGVIDCCLYGSRDGFHLQF